LQPTRSANSSPITCAAGGPRQFTSSGQQWIANLYSNVFRAERDISLSGPQK
jgi:hypothetical protein